MAFVKVKGQPVKWMPKAALDKAQQKLADQKQAAANHQAEAGRAKRPLREHEQITRP